MSRRQHVVRSDDQGGVGTERKLSGAAILSASEDCGDVAPDTSIYIAPIAMTSRGGQRCFVAATIGHISVSNPDPPPPGPGSWTVTFHPYSGTGASPVYNPGTVAEQTITNFEYSEFPDYASMPPGAWNGLEENRGGFFYRWMELWEVSATETVDPPVAINYPIRLALMEASDTAWLTLTISSPYGAGQEDISLP